jgi:3D (Asp-Asp-Asp) domain-containing protein
MRLEDFVMDAGTKVRVQVFGGAIVNRVGFQITENKILICIEEEAEIAAREGRPPIGVGYDADKVFCR